jgi:sugar O-acyltransferase (sialic acid O-acetyltransferase NeuD family)
LLQLFVVRDMEKKIVIYGAGGFAREVLQIIKDINKEQDQEIWNPLGYLVDEAYISSDLGSIDWLKSNSNVFVIVAVGSSSLRRRICEQIDIISGKDSYATLVHPRAWVGEFVEIGSGSIVCSGALITTNVKIGRNVHVNIGSTIGHDAILGDFVTLNPSVNVSGNVKVEAGCEIGTGSVLIPLIQVDAWSIVGAGSVVTKSLPANVTAVGAPARLVKQRESGWHISSRTSK